MARELAGPPVTCCFSQPYPWRAASWADKGKIQAKRTAIKSAEQLSFNTSIGEQQMPLVTLVLTLIVVGVLLWLVNRFIPMQGQIKGILNAVVVIAVVIWLLKVFDLLGYITQFRVGH
jgi:hypothetical protein